MFWSCWANQSQERQGWRIPPPRIPTLGLSDSAVWKQRWLSACPATPQTAVQLACLCSSALDSWLPSGSHLFDVRVNRCELVCKSSKEHSLALTLASSMEHGASSTEQAARSKQHGASSKQYYVVSSRVDLTLVSPSLAPLTLVRYCKHSPFSPVSSSQCCVFTRSRSGSASIAPYAGSCSGGFGITLQTQCCRLRAFVRSSFTCRVCKALADRPSFHSP